MEYVKDRVWLIGRGLVMEFNSKAKKRRIDDLGKIGYFFVVVKV